MAITLAEEIPSKSYFTDAHNILSSFFCEAGFEGKQEATFILRSLIYQIVNQYPAFKGRLLKTYKAREGLFALLDALWALLTGFRREATGPKIYCIIDALDECEPKSREILFDRII